MLSTVNLTIMTLMVMHLFLVTVVIFVGGGFGWFFLGFFFFYYKAKSQIICVYLVPALIHHSPVVCVHRSLTEREEQTCHPCQINDPHLSHRSLSDVFSPERASLYSSTS